MNKLTTRIKLGFGAIALATAVPAMSQAEPYKDYTPSEEVVEMTLVRVDEGQSDNYLSGLRKTWVAANEIDQKLGRLKNFSIYMVPYGDNEFNIVLIKVFTNTDAIAPNKARYMEFVEAYGKANMDAGNKTQIEVYNRIREIKGTYMLRKVTFNM